MQRNTDKIATEESSIKYSQSKKKDQEGTNCSTIKSQIKNTQGIEGSHAGQSGVPQHMKDFNISQNKKMDFEDKNDLIDDSQFESMCFRDAFQGRVKNNKNSQNECSSQSLNQMLHRQRMFYQQLKEKYHEDEPQQREQKLPGQTSLHISYKEYYVDCNVPSNANIKQLKSLIRYRMLQHDLLPKISNILLMQKTESGLTKYLVDEQQKIGNLGNGKRVNIMVSQIGIRSIIKLVF